VRDGLPGGQINSLIGPVWATSPAAIRRRLEDRGLEVDPAQVRQLATQAEAGIRQRLAQGGQHMPPFDYLQPREVDALLLYLRQLTGAPGADKLKPIRLTLRPVRVGEEIVKGTCRICHDATGPGPGDLKLTAVGVIPSLASFAEDRSIHQVVRKIRYGWPVADQQAGHRGEMPLFSYLNSKEAGAIYVYLATYPPQQ
jgi:mono/diheme cytochrome c family protein